MTDERKNPDVSPDDVDEVDASELLLSAFALGELEAKDVNDVEERLRTDPQARATLEEIRATIALVERTPVVEDALDDHKRSTLLEAARNHPPQGKRSAPPSSGGTLRAWGGALAAAAVFAAILPFIWEMPVEEVDSGVPTSSTTAVTAAHSAAGETEADLLLAKADSSVEASSAAARDVEEGRARGATVRYKSPQEELARTATDSEEKSRSLAAVAPGRRPAPTSAGKSTTRSAGARVSTFESIVTVENDVDRASLSVTAPVTDDLAFVSQLPGEASGAEQSTRLFYGEAASAEQQREIVDQLSELPATRGEREQSRGRTTLSAGAVLRRGPEPGGETESVTLGGGVSATDQYGTRSNFGRTESEGRSSTSAADGERRERLSAETISGRRKSEARTDLDPQPDRSAVRRRSRSLQELVQDPAEAPDSGAVSDDGASVAKPSSIETGKTAGTRGVEARPGDLAKAQESSSAPIPAPAAAGGSATTAPADEKAADEKASIRESKDQEAEGETAERDEARETTVDRRTLARARAKALVDEFLTRLDRRPGETPDAMFFRHWGTNPFVEAHQDPLSTFAVDVDTASYTLFRSYLYKRRLLPPREAIRTEEFVNYLDGGYAPTAESGRPFVVHAEAAPSPFAHEPQYKLLRVGIKGREVSRAQRRACSLVFVIDTSGSMRRENRLELVKSALRLLVPELDEGDVIGIVAFDREARTILEPLPASEQERILDGISLLEPRQNTNVNAGLVLGYEMAARQLIADGNNRVILLSDGVANTGNTDPGVMLERVQQYRKQGIYLTCVGVGMGNHNDALLQELANRGDGQCVYVDRVEEARRVFVDDLTGTLEAIARDVKIQVEFDPKSVLRYRLLGYENRAVADADFRNNEVDAGEVGAGHEVTALYELKVRPEAEGTFARVRLRYLTVDHGEAVEFETPVGDSAVRGAFADASAHFRLAACVAETAEILRESYWARGSNLDDVLTRLEPLEEVFADDRDVMEFVALVRSASPLWRQRQGEVDELARTVDALKDASYRRVVAEQRGNANEDADHLRQLQQQTDALRARLEELLR